MKIVLVGPGHHPIKGLDTVGDTEFALWMYSVELSKLKHRVVIHNVSDPLHETAVDVVHYVKPFALPHQDATTKICRPLKLGACPALIRFKPKPTLLKTFDLFTLPRPKRYEALTNYGNLVYLESSACLLMFEALMAGLGLVLSQSAASLFVDDLSDCPWITIVPHSLKDPTELQQLIQTNLDISTTNRAAIRQYAERKWSWQVIVNEYHASLVVPPKEKFVTPVTFMFYPLLDMPGCDLEHTTDSVEKLKTRPQIVAFNTNGWVKHSVWFSELLRFCCNAKFEPCFEECNDFGSHVGLYVRIPLLTSGPKIPRLLHSVENSVALKLKCEEIGWVFKLVKKEDAFRVLHDEGGILVLDQTVPAKEFFAATQAGFLFVGAFENEKLGLLSTCVAAMTKSAYSASLLEGKHVDEIITEFEFGHKDTKRLEYNHILLPSAFIK